MEIIFTVLWVLMQIVSMKLSYEVGKSDGRVDVLKEFFKEELKKNNETNRCG